MLAPTVCLLACLACGCATAGPDPAHVERLVLLEREAHHQRDALLIGEVAALHEAGDYDALVRLLGDELDSRPSGPRHGRYLQELGIAYCERAEQREVTGSSDLIETRATLADYGRCLEVLQAAPAGPHPAVATFLERAAGRRVLYRRRVRTCVERVQPGAPCWEVAEPALADLAPPLP